MSLINHLGDKTLEIPGIEDRTRGETARVRELHFGLANLMPDTAYIQTIKDWAQLINLADQSLQIHLHYVNFDGVERGGAAEAHAQQYGRSVSEVLDEGLDAWIVTGANTEHEYPDLSKVPYLKDFKAVVDSIEDGPVTSGIFSCFAFHTLMQTKFGVHRNLYDPEKEEVKVWGVDTHVVPKEARNHWLTRGGDTHFEAVSSRWGDISAEQATEAGLIVLNQADTVRRSVGAATDRKMNFLGLQTHSEYDSLGLMKEFFRDWNFYIDENGPIKTCPTAPSFLTTYGYAQLLELMNKERPITREERIAFYTECEPEVKVNWKAPGTALIHRWVSGVLKLTSYERKKKYMRGVAPENPMAFLDR